MSDEADESTSIFLMFFLALIYSVVLILAYVRVLPTMLKNCCKNRHSKASEQP